MTSPSDIVVTDTGGTLTFSLWLHRNDAAETGSSDFTLALPGLPLRLDGSGGVHTAFGYNVLLNLAVTQSAGGAPVVTIPDSHLSATLEASLPGFDVSGTLGVLKVEVKDNPANPSSFSGTYATSFAIDGSGVFSGQTKLNGGAGIDLLVSASFGDGQVFDPKFSTDLKIDWTFTNADPNLSGAFGDLPAIAFDNFQLDLGSFFDGLIAPVVTRLKSVTRSLQPVADFLLTDVPILSDIANRSITFEDLIAEYLQTPNLDGFLTAIKVIDEVNVNGFGGLLDLGSFTVHTDLRSGAWTGSDIATFGITDARDPSGELRNESGTMQKLESVDVDFPFLDNPVSILNLLVNPSAPVSLVEWNVPSLDVNLVKTEGDTYVYPGVYVGMELSLGVHTGMTIGFDTRGFATGNLSDGFTVHDGLVDANGTPAVVGIVIDAKIKVGVGIPDMTGLSPDAKLEGTIWLGFNGQNDQGTIGIDQIDTSNPFFDSGDPEIDAILEVEFDLPLSGHQTYTIVKKKLWPA